MSMIDLLEGRRLFSFTAATDAAGFDLNIEVNGAVNVVEVAPSTFEVSDGTRTERFDGVGFINIQGGAGDDLIELNATNATLLVHIDAGSGDDTLVIADYYEDYTSNGTPILRSAGFVVYGGNGADTFVVVQANNAALYGDNADDSFIVRAGSVRIEGANGSDTVTTSAGAIVTFAGGRGADYQNGVLVK